MCIDQYSIENGNQQKNLAEVRRTEQPEMISLMSHWYRNITCTFESYNVNTLDLAANQLWKICAL